ncbi:MAG: T9SS type A sorting domain-containing protein, partial [Bacteroidota bacterium]
VWHTPSTNNDYYVTADGGTGTIDRLEYRPDIAVPFDYEVRFTETCASGDCWGVYTLLGGLRSDGIAVQVPFELWQVREQDDGSFSDVQRLIPLLDAVGEAPASPWPYAVIQGDWDGTGGDGNPNALVSDAVYWMIPDRPDGYALLAADAAAAGGGNLITDTDEQEDIDPTSGGPCRNQGFYIDFCHRNDEVEGLTTSSRSFMPPLGRFQLADEVGDGTPPPTGTVIRLVTQKPLEVSEEDDVRSLPTALTLTVYPNPARASATVRLDLPEASPVRVALYDLLGREVRQVARETRAAGRHSLGLDTAGLATGVYVVAVEAGTARATRKLLVVR